MKFIQEYIAYLNDNPEHYWFKRKPFGWGWTPVTWQGWVVTLVFIGALVLNAVRLDGNTKTDGGFLNPFLIETFLMLGVLIWVCYTTGERPRWEWGFPKNDREEEQ